MINKSEFKSLYTKLKSSSISEEEFKSFLEYINQPENQYMVKEVLDQEAAGKYLDSHLALKNRSEQFFNWRWTIKAASILLLLGMIGIFSYMFFAKGQGEIFYSTENGEILEIQLPDNSLVKLNANSTLKWRNDSENGRLVELSGEAFFNVKHTIDDQKFVVETDQSKITVLGTSFNINSRENDKIFLEEGSIQLEKSGEKSPEMVLLRPGESAIVEKAGPAIQVSVNKMVENEAAWKDGLLQFSDMKLATIIERLEEIYGKDIKVVDTTVLDTEMEFTLPYANWEITGQALALAVGLTLEDNGKIIELK